MVKCQGYLLCPFHPVQVSRADRMEDARFPIPEKSLDSECDVIRVGRAIVPIRAYLQEFVPLQLLEAAFDKRLLLAIDGPAVDLVRSEDEMPFVHHRIFLP